MNCKVCGNAVSVGDKICSVCGNDLEAQRREAGGTGFAPSYSAPEPAVSLTREKDEAINRILYDGDGASARDRLEERRKKRQSEKAASHAGFPSFFTQERKPHPAPAAPEPPAPAVQADEPIKALEPEPERRTMRSFSNEFIFGEKPAAPPIQMDEPEASVPGQQTFAVPSMPESEPYAPPAPAPEYREAQASTAPQPDDAYFALQPSDEEMAKFDVDKKNEEFQELLDKEFERLKNREAETTDVRSQIETVPEQAYPQGDTDVRSFIQERIDSYLRQKDFDMASEMRSRAEVQAEEVQPEPVPAPIPVPAPAYEPAPAPAYEPPPAPAFEPPPAPAYEPPPAPAYEPAPAPAYEPPPAPAFEPPPAPAYEPPPAPAFEPAPAPAYEPPPAPAYEPPPAPAYEPAPAPAFEPPPAPAYEPAPAPAFEPPSAPPAPAPFFEPAPVTEAVAEPQTGVSLEDFEQFDKAAAPAPEPVPATIPEPTVVPPGTSRNATPTRESVADFLDQPVVFPFDKPPAEAPKEFDFEPIVEEAATLDALEEGNIPVAPASEPIKAEEFASPLTFEQFGTAVPAEAEAPAEPVPAPAEPAADAQAPPVPESGDKKEEPSAPAPDFVELLTGKAAAEKDIQAVEAEKPVAEPAKAAEEIDDGDGPPKFYKEYTQGFAVASIEAADAASVQNAPEYLTAYDDEPLGITTPADGEEKDPEIKGGKKVKKKEPQGDVKRTALSVIITILIIILVIVVACIIILKFMPDSIGAHYIEDAIGLFRSWFDGGSA